MRPSDAHCSRERESHFICSLSQISLRTLTALEWVSKDRLGEYSTTADVLACAELGLIDDFCEDVYGDKGPLLPRLAKWLESVADDWSELPAASEKVPMLRKLLTGAVIAPLLLELRSRASNDGSVTLADEKTHAACAVGGFFGAQGWGTAREN